MADNETPKFGKWFDEKYSNQKHFLGTLYQSCNSLHLPENEDNLFQPPPISPFHLGQYFRVVDTPLAD